jgi:hypothetical protein
MKPKATIREMLAELRKDNEWVERRYLGRLPASATSVPHNKVVVHNRTDETAPFLRFWVQFPDDRFEVCPCRFATHLGAHYRVKAARADLPLPANFFCGEPSR